MKHIYRLAALFLAVATVAGFAIAQPSEVVLAIDGGLVGCDPELRHDGRYGVGKGGALRHLRPHIIG